jgi:hypothetical protein
MGAFDKAMGKSIRAVALTDCHDLLNLFGRHFLLTFVPKDGVVDSQQFEQLRL